MGSGGITPSIINLGTRWSKWLASCTGRFIPRERAPGTHWMGGRSERRGEEKISLHLLEIEPR